MEFLYVDNGDVGVMIAPAPARPDMLAVIVVADDLKQIEEVLYLSLRELKAFLEAINAKS